MGGTTSINAISKKLAKHEKISEISCLRTSMRNILESLRGFVVWLEEHWAIVLLIPEILFWNKSKNSPRENQVTVVESLL